MDPVGPQKKIKSNEYRVGFEKLLNDGGSKDSYGGVLKHESGKMKKMSSGEAYEQDQGKVRGGIKHTYGVNGENDAD